MPAPQIKSREVWAFFLHIWSFRYILKTIRRRVLPLFLREICIHNQKVTFANVNLPNQHQIPSKKPCLRLRFYTRPTSGHLIYCIWCSMKKDYSYFSLVHNIFAHIDISFAQALPTPHSHTFGNWQHRNFWSCPCDTNSVFHWPSACFLALLSWRPIYRKSLTFTS